MICETYQITTTETEEVKLEVRNKAGKRVNYKNGTTLTGSDDWLGTDCTLASIAVGTNLVTDANDEGLFKLQGTDKANDVTVGIDATAVLTFDCNKAFDQAEGQRFKATMTLEYQTVGSSLAQRVTGQIFAAISEA